MRSRVSKGIRHPVIRLVTRRIILSVALLLVVSALSFLFLSLTPGDAARELLGPEASPQEYAALRHQLGLDLPVTEQYWKWLTHAVHGDLGTSIFSQTDVVHLIQERTGVTLSLIIGSLLLSILIGITLGTISAVRRGAFGRAVDILSFVGFSLPQFWVGAVLIAIFGVKLGWLPVTGYVPLEQDPGEWLRSLVLPVAALTLGGVAVIAKQTRAAMLDVLGSEYVRVAWANGLSRRSIVYRHALRNAGPPILTVIGIQAISLLGGTVFVETVFALPGLGSLVVDAATRHDLPIVQGVAVYFTIIVIVLNALIDVAYVWLNPRIRKG